VSGGSGGFVTAGWRDKAAAADSVRMKQKRTSKKTDKTERFYEG
jgi:hypothetical protein